MEEIPTNIRNSRWLPKQKNKRLFSGFWDPLTGAALYNFIPISTPLPCGSRNEICQEINYFYSTTTLLLRHQRLFWVPASLKLDPWWLILLIGHIQGLRSYRLVRHNDRLFTPCRFVSCIMGMHIMSLERPTRRRVRSPFDGRALHWFRRSSRYRRRHVYTTCSFWRRHILRPMKLHTISGFRRRLPLVTPSVDWAAQQHIQQQRMQRQHASSTRYRIGDRLCIKCKCKVDWFAHDTPIYSVKVAFPPSYIT